jgi:membrane-bound ClpP family serine protease
MTGLGMALLVIGALIAVAEAHYPTHGIAGGIGVVAMAIGAVLAISGLGAGLLLALLAGLTLAGIGVGIVTLSLKQGVAVRRRRIRTGAEAIVGQVGVVRNWTDSAGSVALDGALWRACRSVARDEDEDHELHAGDSVVVERLTGLTLSVRRAEEWELVL